MATAYNNIPFAEITPTDATVQSFNEYFTTPFEIDTNTFNAMRGFFEGKGFDLSSAESISVILMQQARKDGYNPMSILDTLKGLGSLAISALVSEILNYNRYKTSVLGYTAGFRPQIEFSRNILA